MTDPVRYVVRQYNWLAAGLGVYVRAPGERRIARFDDPDAAAADRFAREQRVRDKHNPFSFGPVLHDLTAFPLGVFRDWLTDADIEPPAEEATDTKPWREWWEAASSRFSAAQRERVWEGLNRVRFHDVIARKDSEVGYAVVRIVWSYDDNWYHAGHESGEPLAVYRSWLGAEIGRERLESEGEPRFNEERTHFFPRDPEQFLDYGSMHDTSYAAARLEGPPPRYEVIEIDLREVVS